MSDKRNTPEYRRHNAAVYQLWQDFAAGHPARVPVMLRTHTRWFLQRRDINVEGYTFQDYYDHPEIMWEIQLRGQRWKRLNVPYTDEYMGYPQQWNGVYPDFHGGLEEVWLGNQPAYFPDNVMDSIPALQQDKEKLYEWELPDPRHGPMMDRVFEYYEFFEEKRKHGDYDGIPIAPTHLLLGTDGPFTVATKLRGTSELCLDMLTDPDYYHRLLDYVTTAAISRTRHGMQFLGQSYPRPSWGFADCAICILSPAQYREFVLPYHKRLLEAFSTGPYNSLHSCGTVQHLHKAIADNLPITSFDCGFAADVAYSRRQVGPKVHFSWRFHPVLQSAAGEAEIRGAIQRILASRVTTGRRFTIEEVAYPDIDWKRWEFFYRKVAELSRYPAAGAPLEDSTDWFLNRGLIDAPGDM